jgi:hypothetical protein
MNLDQVAVGQSQKEATVNQNFTAVAPAALFAQRVFTTTGLTFGFYGGTILVDGTITVINDATVGPLTANTTNYIEASRSGSLFVNTTGFTAGRYPLFEVITATSSITTVTDRRTGDFHSFRKRVAGISVTTADVTLSAVQARNNQLTFSGALTASRSIIVPTLVARYTVLNECTGGTAPLLHSLTIKTSGGTGVQLPRGAWVDVECDGTNVVAVSPAQFTQTLAYAATLGAHDAANGERIIVGVLTGGITIPAPTNPRIGQKLTYSFTQDGTGGRTITWNAVFKKAADGAGTANQVACTEYMFDGTSWVQQGGALAWF